MAEQPYMSCHDIQAPVVLHPSLRKLPPAPALGPKKLVPNVDTKTSTTFINYVADAPLSTPLLPKHNGKAAEARALYEAAMARAAANKQKRDLENVDPSLWAALRSPSKRLHLDETVQLQPGPADSGWSHSPATHFDTYFPATPCSPPRSAPTRDAPPTPRKNRRPPPKLQKDLRERLSMLAGRGDKIAKAFLVEHAGKRTTQLT